MLCRVLMCPTRFASSSLASWKLFRIKNSVESYKVQNYNHISNSQNHKTIHCE